MSKLYLRFLRNVSALEANKKNMKVVDSTAMLLLSEIAIQHFDEKPLTVSQAMQLTAIASSATIHKKIDYLREAGLIDLTFDGQNRRTKYLIPSKAAHVYFEKMSESMLKAYEN